MSSVVTVRTMVDAAATLSDIREGSRCDSSPAWLSWIGAGAALKLIGQLDPAETERHCVGLASAFLDAAAHLGFEPLTSLGRNSHIAVVRSSEPAALARALKGRAIKASLLGDRLRVGFHFFNNEADLSRLLDALLDAR